MSHTVSVTMDCPSCGDELEVEVVYSGRFIAATLDSPAEGPTANVVSMVCANACAFTPKQEADIEAEAIALADETLNDTDDYDEEC